MSKRCELQKEYYQQHGNYKGSGKYSDNYVNWLESELLAMRLMGDAEPVELRSVVCDILPMSVTGCCGLGPITNENYCPKCGRKIKRDNP